MSFIKYLQVYIFIFLYIADLFKTGNVNFIFFELDSIPKSLNWCGPDRSKVFVITENNSLYKSEDKGFSWKKLNDILINKAKDTLEQSDNEIGKVSEMIQSPVDNSLLIFLGTHGINWFTEDCGKKISALNNGRKIHEFVFHPTEKNWILASAYSICEDFKNEPCKKFKELYYTKNLGEKWNVLLPYVVQFGWGCKGEKHIQKGIPKERILITYEPKGKGDQKQGAWNYKVDLIYTDDFLKTKKTALHKGNKFLLTEDYLFVAQVADQELQEVNLYVSQINDKKYSFETISINNGKFLEHSYTFLDMTEKSVFLNINHFGSQSKYGHVYISDITGSKYSMSLPYNIRYPDSSQCDFDKLTSLDGIYIGNSIDYEYIKEYIDEYQKEAITNEIKMDNQVNSKKFGKIENGVDEITKDFAVTQITFNKGGTWQRIKAPDVDSNGKVYDCVSNCYLNIHGVSSDYPQFYSVESAAGIILANGNVGKYLSHKAEDISTFLSRDGGRNWIEIKKGSHTYEIGDHGGIIVLCDHLNPTDTFYYSWNEGLTWKEQKYSNQKISVKNILIEPTSISQNFIIYGDTQNVKGKKKGAVIGIDFSSLNERKCKGSDIPDQPESDYETWSPSGNIGECLLGKKSIYVRRKRETECYNGLEFERKTDIKFCDCNEKDYECDEGYKKDINGNTCVEIDESIKKIKEGEYINPPENCNGYYKISKGYRKIPDNKCINGVKYDPIIIPCPYSGLFSIIGIIFFVIIILVLLSLAILTFNKDVISFLFKILSREKKKEEVNQVLTSMDKYIDLSDDNQGLFEENDLILNTINKNYYDETKLSDREDNEKP